MVEQLRKKFIFSAMLAILLVLLAIVCAISGLNRYQMERNTDTLLDFMIMQGEIFSENETGYGPFVPENGEMRQEHGPEVEDDTDDDLDDDLDDLDELPSVPYNRQDESQGMFGGGRFDEETPFRTRYFSVYYSPSGSYAHSRLNNIASVSEDKAIEYGDMVLSSGKERGKVDNFKYQRIETAAGETGFYFLDISEEKENLRSNLISSLIVAVVSYLVLFALIYVISGRIVKPFADNIERQKQFITDAGHEIKTPLAIISANTEAIEMIAGKSEWTENIHSQIKRLTDLVQRLLVLSRMEETGLRITFTEFSLSDAVADIAEPFITLAESQDKKIALDIEPDLLLNGDERGIRDMVSILCDNAVKYCDPNGNVRIHLSGTGKKKVLTVSNSCTGAEKAKVENWFSRFYREDSSRSRSTGGFGIGLSIAKAVVEAHKGKISAEFKDGDVIMTAEL
ncbi:MAG: HAMP domain-containing histidine kinase [Oscillospiraceae bacterium]|nr:HAMP domain-containing histidine kinase [Oscillospiraceae bacterium]